MWILDAYMNFVNDNFNFDSFTDLNLWISHNVK